MNYQQVHNLIRKSRRILIATHVNPDLDAISSELAMAEYLKRQGKEIVIVHEKPLARMFQNIPGSQQIKTLTRALTFQHDLALVLDCADRRRIGSVERILGKEKPIINIDHHLTSERFGHVNIIDPKASSTAEVIFEMFKAWNVDLTKRLASCLYLGILTDTGSFRYQNTTARTHRIAAELLSFGLSPIFFYRLAYEDLEAKDFKVLTRIVNQARYFKQGKIVFLSLSAKILKETEERFDLKDKLFYILRLMKNVEVIALFSFLGAQRTRVNFRSTKKINVAAIAQIFGGGGHRAASGCMLDQGIKKAEQMVLEEILRKVV